MTNFERIRNYYKNFDEKNRLKNDASGRLEFLMTMSVLEKHLPSAGGTNNDAGAVTVLVRNINPEHLSCKYGKITCCLTKTIIKINVNIHIYKSIYSIDFLPVNFSPK